MTPGQAHADLAETSDPASSGERPVVSVLLLAFNHGCYIDQAIESVIAQATSFPFEVVIGEDGSSDDTLQRAVDYQRRYPAMIRILSTGANVGLYRNYRRVLQAARGEYLAHLDGDDFWLPGKLAAQVEFLQSHPAHAAVYANALTVDESGRRLGLFNNIGSEGFDLADMLRRGNFLNTSSMMFRASLRDTLLDIDRLFIDYRIHLRLARHGLLFQLGGQPLAAYRVGATGSMTSRSKELVRTLYWEAIMDVPRDHVTDAEFANGVANFLRRIASGVVRGRRWDLFRKWVPRVLAASPYGPARTILLALGSAMRASWLAAMQRLQADDGMKPLHRR